MTATYSARSKHVTSTPTGIMSLTAAATPTEIPTSDPSQTPLYSYGTSKIVRTAVAAGVIVLALSALVLFFKISSWIRYHQRLRRQRDLTEMMQKEQLANSFEIAAWSDEPGQAPIYAEPKKDKKSRRELRSQLRAMKRGGANAYAVFEWEGVAG